MLEASPMQSGTVAEWAGALASIASALIAIWALFIAKQANKKADEIYAIDAEKSRLRERRELAKSFHAWWVYSEKLDVSGIMIASEGTGATVYSSIEIVARIRDEEKKLELPLFPPGQYVFPSLDDGWDEPSQMTDDSDWKPIMNDSDRTIIRIEYVDQIGEYWIWTPERGLLKPGQ